MNRALEPLPCGNDPRTLVDQVFGEGEPASLAQAAHQATCPYCGASLASLRTLLQDVGTVAAEPVSAPPNFARRVMARVRDTAHEIEVSTATFGSTTVTQALVTRIARLAAMKIPNVTFALADAEEAGEAGGGERLSLTVRLVAVYGVDLHQLASAVRERVVHDVRRTIGVPLGRVDVFVEELSG